MKLFYLHLNYNSINHFSFRNNSLPLHTASYILLYFILNIHFLFAQTLSYGPKTSPNVEFTFNTMNKYQNGLTIPNVLTLNINADLTQWDLYVGATSANPGFFEVSNYYSTTGNEPDVGLLQIRLRNTSNTSQVTGFIPLTDIAIPTDIIGNHLGADDPVDCDDPAPVGTNKPGNYLTRPECYRFSVDLRVTPGLAYRAGLYTLRIDFMLVQDL